MHTASVVKRRIDNLGVLLQHVTNGRGCGTLTSPPLSFISSKSTDVTTGTLGPILRLRNLMSPYIVACIPLSCCDERQQATNTPLTTALGNFRCTFAIFFSILSRTKFSSFAWS